MVDTQYEIPIVDEEAEAPPRVRLPPREWIRKNLFSNWWNSLLTVAFGALIVWALLSLIRWLAGVDATIIRANLTLYMAGRFPRDQLPRLWYGIYVAVAVVGFVAGAVLANARARAEESGLPFEPDSPLQVLRRFWLIPAVAAFTLSFTQTITPTLLTLLALAIGFAAFVGGRSAPASVRRWLWSIPVLGVVAFYLTVAGFGGVGWDLWGGFFLNIVLTLAGITLAFPIGLVLALGRRSSLPGVRALCVSYIEFFRGVPLITLLLMGSFAIGFLIPGRTVMSLFLRLLIAITIFESAYIAEVVRGGLQGVPKAQVEGAQALGLTPWPTMRTIVLPQALRNVIPAMVGQFISLYKDTTLVAIVGLLDLLAAAQVSTAQPEFLAQGLEAVTLPFAALFFWVGSYVMSRESRRLERTLGVGTR